MSVWAALQFIASVFEVSLISFFLYVLPGLALLQWARPGKILTWPEQLGLSISISVTLYPLLLLWCYLAGVQPGAFLAWVPGGVALIAFFPHYRTWWRAGFGSLFRYFLSKLRQPGTLFFLALLLFLITVRLAAIREMVAPAWGDSVHHTYIVQLMLDHGGLFRSWQPYAPIQSFTYHFGFHTLVAVWAWFSGDAAPQAVLIAGQVLNACAVIVLYPLAYRLSGKTSVGIAAVVVAGLLSTMPAFYVNWGRYTQLAGQIPLLGLLWFFDVWWSENRPTRRLLLPVLICAAGLILTHYRIALLAGAGGAAWALWGFWLSRQHLQQWLGRLGWLVAAGIGSVGLVLPWLWRTRSGRLETVATVVGERSVDYGPLWADLAQWSTLNEYYAPLLWITAILALCLALVRLPRLGIPVALWLAITFLITNPFLVALPGTGYITNFVLIIALYMPLGILVGWLLGEMAIVLWRQTWIGRVLVSGVAVVLLGVGTLHQLRVVDPFFQMVTPQDERAFAWIQENTPRDAHFLVNSFPAYSTLVVGSDAGWWLPLYTKRVSTLPPVIYFAEQLEEGVLRTHFLQIELDLQQSNGDPARLRDIFCQDEITHVFLGQHQGQVGYGDMSPLPPDWFVQNPDFSLLYQQEQAQVWAFDQKACQQG